MKKRRKKTAKKRPGFFARIVHSLKARHERAAKVRKLTAAGRTGHEGKVFTDRPSAEATQLVREWVAKNGKPPSAALVEGFTGARPGYWRGKRVAGHVLR